MNAKLLKAERFVNLKTGCSYRYVQSSTEYFRPHYHDYYEIFLVLEGEALHLINGRKLKLHPRDLVFIRPRDVHDYVCAGDRPYSMLNITFTTETLEALFGFLGEGFPGKELLEAELPPAVMLSESEFARLERRMESLCAIQPDSTDELRSAMRILLFEIFTRCFSGGVPKAGDSPEWLDALCEEMERNGNFIHGTARLLELSDKSREHLSRCMKKYKGVTPSEFVNNIRLNYIANMLVNSNHNIADIIFESGFNNISWANELFKRKFGTTMHRFRMGEQ